MTTYILTDWHLDFNNILRYAIKYLQEYDWLSRICDANICGINVSAFWPSELPEPDSKRTDVRHEWRQIIGFDPDIIWYKNHKNAIFQILEAYRWFLQIFVFLEIYPLCLIKIWEDWVQETAKCFQLTTACKRLV